jgi:hypothetical protein
MIADENRQYFSIGFLDEVYVKVKIYNSEKQHERAAKTKSSLCLSLSFSHCLFLGQCQQQNVSE